MLIEALENPESRQRIINQFETSPRSREAANLIKEEYSRIAFTMPRTDGEAGYIGVLGEDKGIAISKGGALDGPLSERQPVDAATLSWPKVQRRIAQLVENGRFLDAVEQAPAQEPAQSPEQEYQEDAPATEPEAALDAEYIAADLKTARNDVLKTLESIFFTQNNRNGIVGLLNENATNSDIGLHLSNSFSGMTIIKAEPDSDISAVTTSKGIENTLINRLIAWEDIAPVVRSLGMQWKAEQEAEKPLADPGPSPDYVLDYK